MADRKVQNGKKEVVYKSRTRKDSELNAEEYDTVVLRNLVPSTDIADIKQGLEQIGYKVLSIRSAYSQFTGLALPLFFIKLHKTPFNATIFQLKYVAHQVVLVEEYLQGPDLPRCTRCQDLDHTKESCTKSPVCAWCSGSHFTTVCKEVKTSVPTCSRCGGCHPASYKGCKVYRQRCLMKALEESTKNKKDAESKESSPEMSVIQVKLLEENNPVTSASSLINSTNFSITYATSSITSPSTSITSNNYPITTPISLFTPPTNNSTPSKNSITSNFSVSPSRLFTSPTSSITSNSSFDYFNNSLSPSSPISSPDYSMPPSSSLFTSPDSPISSANQSNPSFHYSLNPNYSSSSRYFNPPFGSITAADNSVTSVNYPLDSSSSLSSPNYPISPTRPFASSISSKAFSSSWNNSDRSSADAWYSLEENVKPRNTSCPPGFSIPPLPKLDEISFNEQLKIVADVMEHFSSMNEDLYLKL